MKEGKKTFDVYRMKNEQLWNRWGTASIVAIILGFGLLYFSSLFWVGLALLAAGFASIIVLIAIAQKEGRLTGVQFSIFFSGNYAPLRGKEVRIKKRERWIER